ncbi:amine oxidase [Elysia marginata]|uniref:Amine oxidase n=1 Tax=Elysia marginata TaxID=1093978 RepID=A0AAV4ITD1_9GAST|nr:amine oxidase [Elysia marginata]
MEEDQAVLSETQEEFDKHMGVVEDLNDELELSNIPHTPLTITLGPIASALDTVLNKHRIIPQAYHSRSFIGNHCHKYLQPHVYTDLTSAIKKETKAQTIHSL